MACRSLLAWKVVLFASFISTLQGAEDLYSNSFISPNSAKNSGISNVPQSADKTLAPDEISQSSKYQPKYTCTESHSIPVIHNGVRIPRSPILSKTSGIDNLLVYKNIEDTLDSNDVELSGRIGRLIQPSKTEENISSEVHQMSLSLSGEDQGAPLSKALEEPRQITPTATMTINTASQYFHSPRARQANPDIQDIITGIVKLLNGNVNVQANTAPNGMGRPLRPLSTRINNRGPPRITDVPALPLDFDVPAPPLPPPPLGQIPPPVVPSRFPTPYPFDLPPHNTPPIRPFPNDPMHPSKRPSIYRPITIPPWNRPPMRRPPMRRPVPIPPYKPLPPMASDYISLTSEKPMEDVLTLDLGDHLQPSHEDDIVSEEANATTSSQDESSLGTDNSIVNVTSNSLIDKEAIDFERNKDKNTLKKEKQTIKTTSVTPTAISSTSKVVINTSELENNTSEAITNDTMSSITSTSYSSSDILATPTETTPSSTKTNIAADIPTTNSNSVLEETTESLESSMIDIGQKLKEEATSILSSTPTAALPMDTTTNVVNSSTYDAGTNSSTLSSSTQSQSVLAQAVNQTSHGFPYYPYRPRPGIVLDDTEYKPGRQPIVTRPPIGQIGDIFDVTVSAIQGPGSSASQQGKPFVIPVDIDNVNVAGNQDVITSSIGSEGFVSIDGKRTYLNLFGDAAPPTSVGAAIKPTAPVSNHNHVTGTGFAVVENEKKPNLGSVKPTQRRPLYGRPRPSQPPVRIDTCIVGDDSTCDASQHEICRTEVGVSACHCRPGYARRKHRDPCRRIVSVLLSLRVDRIYEKRIVWASELGNEASESYQQLSYEAQRALESAMSMTPFSDEFLGAKVNSIYRGERSAGQAGVFVNLTLQLEENIDTSRSTLRAEIQKHLLGVIQRRSNNIGNSALWVDSPPGSISNLQDLDECSSPELHDCHSLAKCINIFGSFKCECEEGFRDLWSDNKHRAGRECEQCSPQHCNNRGECKYQNGLEVCVCSGNYYGSQCELDGEVLGVAIGASVAAVIIIGLTLVCLVMWSRRWSREHKAAVGSPVFGYMATASNTVKAPVVGGPPYQLTMEDRIRWAQLADVMASANHYAPEPVAPTRPSSAALFGGYPTLSMSGTLQHGSMHGTLPPVPLPRLNLQAQMANRAASLQGMRPLDNSSSSEEEDKADLLGRNFQVPRPKSRSNASIANQSGIYYDVDYDQHEIYKQAGGIPLSTYSIGRPYFRN